MTGAAVNIKVHDTLIKLMRQYYSVRQTLVMWMVQFCVPASVHLDNVGSCRACEQTASHNPEMGK